jgi:hypothetical protein
MSGPWQQIRHGRAQVGEHLGGQDVVCREEGPGVVALASPVESDNLPGAHVPKYISIKRGAWSGMAHRNVETPATQLLRWSQGPAAVSPSRHVVTEEAVVEVLERATLVNQLVGDATPLEGEEQEEMAEDARGVSGARDVFSAQAMREGRMAHEEPGREPGGAGRPVGERLVEGKGLLEGEPGGAKLGVR